MDFLIFKDSIIYNIIMENNIIKNNKISYLKTDDNKIINEYSIRWVKKFSECLEVCTKLTGCDIKAGDTHRICKISNFESYNKLNKFFD
jgi:hypothetical protein